MMPTPPFYCCCDCCTAGWTWTARKGVRELHFCGHHAHAQMDALIMAGFIVAEVKPAESTTPVGV